MSERASPVPGYVKAADGSPLYCVHHPAAARLATPQCGHSVVILPSLFEERKSGYAALRRLAECLAAAGHAVVRFDYRGSGESGADPAKRRWAHLAEDVATARRTLAQLTGCGETVLIGLRLGATLALQLASTARAVVALAPVVKGAGQVRLWKMRSKIRSELTQANTTDEVEKRGGGTEGDVRDFDGYEVGQAFFDDVARIDLINELKESSCPTLAVQLSHRTEPSPETLELVKKLGARGAGECLRIEAFWDKVDDVDTRPIEDLVLKWLETI